MSEPSDSEVIAASRADPARFGMIFDRHHAAIQSYLQRRVGRDEGDDLAAETFLRAFASRSHYVIGRQDAKPWLFGIATNLLRHRWRHERRQLRAYARTGIDPVAPAIEELEERVDAALAGPLIAGALASLPRGERDVLLLHAWADLSHTEIAEALGIPPGRVRARLLRARRRMSERISPSGKEGDEELSDNATGDKNGRARGAEGVSR